MCFSPVEAVVPYVPPEHPAAHIGSVCWSADAVFVGLVVDEVAYWDVVGVFGVGDG